MSQAGALSGSGGGGGGPAWISGTVTTTDATPTALVSLATVNNSSIVAFALVTGWDAGDGQCIGYNVSASGCNVAGTFTVAIPDKTGDQGAALVTATVTFVASGANMILQVTGVAGKTIKWKGGFWYEEVS